MNSGLRLPITAASHTPDQLKKLIRDVPDFPKTGILFKDITPVLMDPMALQSLVVHMAALVPKNTTKLAAIESRGFLLGAALATRLGLGLVLLRKPGKLPHKTIAHSYDLEYGQDTLHIHVDALDASDRVCIVDDVLATGGTAKAAEALCRKTGANVAGFAFMLELGFLNGKDGLSADAASLIIL